MNREFYLGLFFGGILMAIIIEITSLFKLEGLAILFYYVPLALIISIHHFIENKTKDKE